MGTPAQNNLDRKNKQRNANTSGENNPFSKLTNKQVIEIKNRLNLGEKGKDLAFAFNVHVSTISKIKKNINWKDINNGLQE